MKNERDLVKEVTELGFSEVLNRISGPEQIVVGQYVKLALHSLNNGLPIPEWVRVGLDISDIPEGSIGATIAACQYILGQQEILNDQL